MPRKRKLIWLSLAALPVVIVAAALCWPRTPALPPQTLKMPDGTVYEFVGVTYGTNHVLGSAPARLVNRLPAPLANFARKILGPRLTRIDGAKATPEPSLCVWFEHVGTAVPPGMGGPLRLVYAKLADENGVESGVQCTFWLPGISFGPPEFPVVPRRSRTLQVYFYEANGQEQIQHEIGRVKFPNPVYGKYPQWQPDTGPAVRKAGDLEIRLDNFFVGNRRSGTPIRLANGSRAIDYRPVARGERAETVFDVSLASPEGSNGLWLMQNARLSDATGNVIDNSSITGSSGTSGSRSGLTPMFGVGESRKSLTGALWPDESAWKLKLEFKRTSGFAPEELVTFKQVPVPALGTTNQPNLTIRVGDVRLVLTEFIRNPAKTNSNRVDRRPETQLRVELPGRPEGIAVDLVKMRTDTGEEPRLNANQWMPGARVIGLTFIPANAQTVDITFAVQKTRAVEFLLKPPK